jgi:Fur family iron response transcriptional regulator
VARLEERLRLAGLRLTRPRMALAKLLFGEGDRHFTAEMIFAEAQAARLPISLATVYNTLNQFTAAGLLREVAIEGDRTYFDTNTSNHFHYFLEGQGELVDIHADGLRIEGLPDLPAGTVIDRIDVVVRLKPKA